MTLPRRKMDYAAVRRIGQYRRLRTVQALTETLIAKLGRTPSDEELAGMLAMTVTKLQQLRRLRG